MIDVWKYDQDRRQLLRDLKDFRRVRRALVKHDAAGTTDAWLAVEPADLRPPATGRHEEGG